MIIRFALRSLAVRPIKTLVLACGFGLGIAVMAVLLGVGEVILDQARSPALQGGGDVVASGAFGPLDSGRFVLSSVSGSSGQASGVRAVSPWKKATLYLVTPGKIWPLTVRAGVPSLEKAVGNPEVASQSAWADEPRDREWKTPDPHEILRAMDRFHAQPDVPEFAQSWAEWLYFNGRTPDGRVRFYLTFLVGPSAGAGRRTAGVRLQLDRDGRQSNYSVSAEVDESSVMASAPNLDIGDNHVRLEGLRYEVALRLPAEGRRDSSLTGTLVLDAVPGRSLPPAVIHGARNWLSGYVVPVLSGTWRGALTVDGVTLTLDAASGYHDHNWGFWQDVRWQWGQVAHDDLSFVYGRVFPPASIADPDRVPGFLGVLGPAGPLAISTDVSIAEQDDDDGPQEIVVTGKGSAVDLVLRFSVDRAIRTGMRMTRPVSGGAMDFLQLGGVYRVTGHAGDRSIDFSARGAAETFRHR